MKKYRFTETVTKPVELDDIRKPLLEFETTEDLLDRIKSTDIYCNPGGMHCKSKTFKVWDKVWSKAPYYWLILYVFDGGTKFHIRGIVESIDDGILPELDLPEFELKVIQKNG